MSHRDEIKAVRGELKKLDAWLKKIEDDIRDHPTCRLAGPKIIGDSKGFICALKRLFEGVLDCAPLNFGTIFILSIIVIFARSCHLFMEV